MRDSKPQRCVQQPKSLKATRNPTNPDKHINEAPKQTFANNFFKISSKYTQGMFSNWKICFNAINIQTYDELFCILGKLNETEMLTTLTTFPNWFQKTTKTKLKCNEN